ncbi:hypothetical protein CsatB_029579 [Cannabis sativa]
MCCCMVCMEATCLPGTMIPVCLFLLSKPAHKHLETPSQRGVNSNKCKPIH